MSRSGYIDDGDDCLFNLWRGTVANATYGKRGQKLLRDMLTALDAMPKKELIIGDLVRDDGSCCALGALAKARKMDVSKIDPDDVWHVAEEFGIARSLAAEIVYMNDEASFDIETPAKRFDRMRAWVSSQIKAASDA